MRLRSSFLIATAMLSVTATRPAVAQSFLGGAKDSNLNGTVAGTG